MSYFSKKINFFICWDIELLDQVVNYSIALFNRLLESEPLMLNNLSTGRSGNETLIY